MSGIIKEIFIMYMILILHEIGHLIVIKKYKYKVTKIELLPFGAIIECNFANSSLKEEFLLYVSGITVNFLFFIILLCFKNFGLIFYFNLIMLVFNLIPISPLDGGRLLETLMSNSFKYKKALLISTCISSVCLVVFLTYMSIFFFNLNMLFIFSYLLMENYINIKTYKKKYNMFLLNKYLYPNNKLKNIKFEPKYKDLCSNLYKGKNNTILLGKKELNEEKILKIHFNSK